MKPPKTISSVGQFINDQLPKIQSTNVFFDLFKYSGPFGIFFGIERFIFVIHLGIPPISIKM